MSREAKKRRGRARRLLEAIGLGARPLLRVFDRWDEEAIRLGEAALRCGPAADVPGALDAVRRLRPRDKFGEFRYWFKPRGEQTIRLLDEAATVVHEHRIEGVTHDERVKSWIREGRAPHFSVGSRVVSSPHEPANPCPAHGAGSE
jgi:hypothetical protein